MNTQILAADFGLTALPANQPGGTNYAISGAVDAAVAANGNIGNLNQNTTLPSTVQQMANYLAGHGGTANLQALYVISSGGNDVTFARDNIVGFTNQETYLANQAQALANAIRNIQVTGGQHILVNGLAGSGTLPTFYTQRLFADLSAAGVNFIACRHSSLSFRQSRPIRCYMGSPLRQFFQVSSVRVLVQLAFGPVLALTQVGASGAPTRRCQVTDTRTFRSADAEQTSFYSDDQHFSAAGQMLVAAYDFSLLSSGARPHRRGWPARPDRQQAAVFSFGGDAGSEDHRRRLRPN